MQRDDNEREAVEQVCKTLPPSASFVYHVGTMPSRARRAVRVAVEGVPKQVTWPKFLSRIGWGGPIELVEETLTDMLTVHQPGSRSLWMCPHRVRITAHRPRGEHVGRRAHLL